MNSNAPVLDKKSVIFFATFFLAIALSIVAIHTNVVVLKSYHAFSEDDDIPDPTSVYGDLFDYFAHMRTF